MSCNMQTQIEVAATAKKFVDRSEAKRESLCSGVRKFRDLSVAAVALT
ncbi:hypothetical protein HC248_00677 [Polaromonas vacuolata]|uniref:Uncharacterized protein n=1 Tax=Polaromonas vacuolata TaxID=37448 RepID=A0A6H2H6B3_9BURK|nr:hypothetical protein HC248_00677 [Polaromonas vacuolata]